jgi:tRNA(adenine34) deaminase
MNKNFFDLAFSYAQVAYDNDEVPVGAVIVKDGVILGFGSNSKEKDCFVTSHAEIKAILMAEEKINNWRLDDCEMYVTLDPCPMCASAIKQARIKKVFSAVSNSDPQNCEIITQIFEKNDKINQKVFFSTNMDADRAKKILNSFFKAQRDKKV